MANFEQGQAVGIINTRIGFDNFQGVGTITDVGTKSYTVTKNTGGTVRFTLDGRLWGEGRLGSTILLSEAEYRRREASDKYHRDAYTAIVALQKAVEQAFPGYQNPRHTRPVPQALKDKLAALVAALPVEGV